MKLTVPYKYIVIEGNIGAGKTTLATKIADLFKAKLVLEQFADNPFLPKFYQNPDRYAFTLELSFLATRFKQLNAEINNSELFTSFTIADYYFIKSLVFARTTLNTDEYLLYRQVYDIIYQQLPQPNLYIYLHSNPDRLIANIKQRARQYEQNIEEQYLKNLQNSYFEYFKTVTKFPVIVIETTMLDFVNNPIHFNKIVEIITKNGHKPGLQIIENSYFE